MKAAVFGLILFVVMSLLYCLLDSDSPQLKDIEFRTIAPLMICLCLLLTAFLMPDGRHDKHNDWEPN